MCAELHMMTMMTSIGKAAEARGNKNMARDLFEDTASTYVRDTDTDTDGGTLHPPNMIRAGGGAPHQRLL